MQKFVDRYIWSARRSMVVAMLIGLALAYIAQGLYGLRTARTLRGRAAAGTDLMVGILLLSIAAVVGVRLINPVVTALVDAENISGIDTSAAALLPVGQLIAVVVLGIGTMAGGLYFIFAAAKKGFG